MCLITVAWKTHPSFELVVAANRDEFHDRPALPADYWKDAPRVFGGRDRLQNGSWLAIEQTGRLACVTNIRRMVPPNPEAPSRGSLVADFVRGAQPARSYAQEVAVRAGKYSGFNLLVWDGKDLDYVNNHPGTWRTLEPGVHVVSNADLDTPWPKTRRLRQAMAYWVGAGGLGPEPLLDALADRDLAPDDQLPDTGVGPTLERMLSAPFIVSPGYGTRCSTVVMVSEHSIEFLERRFNAKGKVTGETRKKMTRIAPIE